MASGEVYFLERCPSSKFSTPHQFFSFFHSFFPFTFFFFFFPFPLSLLPLCLLYFFPSLLQFLFFFLSFIFFLFLPRAFPSLVLQVYVSHISPLYFCPSYILLGFTLSSFFNILNLSLCNFPPLLSFSFVSSYSSCFPHLFFPFFSFFLQVLKGLGLRVTRVFPKI